MSDLVYKYPLDLTGISPENKVIGEPHTLQPGINRSAVPLYGAFYTESLVVRDADTTEILTPNDQYLPIMYHEEASERSGKEVCGGVIVTDGTVSQNIILDYQLVGGDFQNITQIILDLIENLNLDEREVMWGDLLGRPNAFPPAHHLHDVGDLFGFEYLVESVNSLREAVLYGDVASHDELKAMIEDRRQQLQDAIDAFRADYDEFIARRDNPHEVSKAQVGLGSVANHPLANQDEAEEGSLNSRYMTPLRVYQSINVFAIEPLQEHKEDYTNPHRVTKAQVGLGIVENFRPATSPEAIEGLSNTTYMTPSVTKDAITTQAVEPLVEHTDRTDNPHQVTKAQTGLGSVSNYPDATQSEAEAGEANNRFMTALRVSQAIAAQVGDAYYAHASNFGNPHNVTKAQVGLSNVPNWTPASTGQAQTAEITTAFMSPKRTHEFLLHYLRKADDSSSESVVGTVGWYGQNRTAGGFYGGTADPQNTNRVNIDANLHATAFVGNGRNLTGMVKSQVGLANVDNFATASQIQAEEGSLNDRFMTPLRVAQAISVQAGTLLQAHVDNTSNPHSVTKAQVGLGNVANYPVANKAEAELGESNVRYMTALRVSQAITEQAGTLLQSHVDDKTNPHEVTKAQVGLGSVDNFSRAHYDGRYLRQNLPVDTQVAGEVVVPAGETAGGRRFSVVVRNSGGDVGGLYIKSGDTDNDELAFEAVNYLNQSIFSIEAVTGRLKTRTAPQVRDGAGNYQEVFWPGNKPTKADVGLGNVPNWSAGTATDLIEGTAVDKFLSPAAIKSHLDTRFGDERRHTDYRGTYFDSAVSAYTFEFMNIIGDGVGEYRLLNRGSVDRKYQADLLPDGDPTTFLTQDKTFKVQIQVPQEEYDAWIASGAKVQFDVAGDTRINSGVTATIELYIAAVPLGPGYSGTEFLVATHQVTGNGTPENVGLSKTVVYENNAFTDYVSPEIASHSQSSDHDARYDARYVKKEVEEETSLRTVGSTLEAYVGGSWRQVWPPQWQ